MRRKKEAVLCFESNDEGLPKVVRDYRARYRAISQVLDQNPEILDLVHKDLQKLSEGDSTGREGDYTVDGAGRQHRTTSPVGGRDGPGLGAGVHLFETRPGTRKLAWTIVGDQEAAALSVPEYRAPWKFPEQYL